MPFHVGEDGPAVDFAGKLIGIAIEGIDKWTGLFGEYKNDKCHHKGQRRHSSHHQGGYEDRGTQIHIIDFQPGNAGERYLIVLGGKIRPGHGTIQPYPHDLSLGWKRIDVLMNNRFPLRMLSAMLLSYKKTAELGSGSQMRLKILFRCLETSWVGLWNDLRITHDWKSIAMRMIAMRRM